jgi:hypothetical protein
MVVTFYAGPKCGMTATHKPEPERGHTTCPGFPKHTYVYDGAGRFVWTETRMRREIIRETRAALRGES